MRDCAGCGEPYEVGVDVHLCYDPDDAPTLQLFLECEDLVRLIVGPVGSGKSSASVMEMIRRATEMPACQDGIRRSRAVVIRNTYRELSDTTRKTFEQWIPPTPRGSEGGAYSAIWDENDFSCTVRFGDVELEVLFRALDRPQDVKKLLSMEVTFCYINEAREVPKAVFDMVQTRLGRFPRKSDVTTPANPTGEFWFGLWADTNPPDTDHWIFRLFEEEKPEVTFDLEMEDGSKRTVTVRYALFHQPSGLSKEAENRKHLQPGYYERQMVGKDEDWINVNVRSIYGFVKEGKPVFPEYRDDAHCKPVTPRPELPILLGQDFGLTPACVLAQREPRSGQIQVFDELVSSDMGAVSFAKELKRLILAKYPGRDVRGHGDPAGEGRSQVDERTPFQVMNEAGIPMDPAPTNDLRRRIEAVKGLLMRRTFTGAEAVLIDPKCKVLRKALAGGYCRARVQVAGDERFKDEPIKNEFSHVADAFQYLCVGEGEDDRAIEGARAGRKVKVNIKVKRALRAW